MDAKGFKKITTAFFIFPLIFLSLSLPAQGAVPAAPAGLTAIAGNGEASLNWTAVSGVTDYVLYRGAVSGGPYSFVAQTQGTGYMNRSLSNGTRYYYVVTALNANGQSPYSAPIDVTPGTTVLKAPDGVTALPGNGEVSLTWNPVTSAVSYQVLRGTSPGGPYTLLTPVATGPSFTDKGLSNVVQYFYVIQTMISITSTNLGAYSEEVGATPSALLPAAPTNFSASPGSTWADLSWSPSEGATAYAVYRGVKDGGPYTLVAQPNTTAYEDTDLANGTTYYYVVAAANAQGAGAFSAQASAPVSATEKPHAALLSLHQAADHFANIVWEGAIGAQSYTVLRSTTKDDPDPPYESNPISGTSYSDSNLENGTTYYYVVDTHNANATIARSNEVAVTPELQLPAPEIADVMVGNTQATVTWVPVVGAYYYSATASLSSGGKGSGCY
ncbi:MAG: fibronectin type III domain-containing protein [Syntrophales bacterium]|jgi:fibronectin type 3 domain-containing protein|nr:fibronectin type III domain-containing protein [Syntrophales bacterium]